MSRILLILLISGIVIIGYFVLPPTEPKKVSEATANKIQEDEVTDNQRTQALTHIRNMTEHSGVSIDASSANHFVTEDQLIQLPRIPGDNVILSQSNDIASNDTAQTFGVSIPVFNAQNNTVSNAGNMQSSRINSPNMTTQIKLKELLDQSDSDGRRIFYIHAVNPHDKQGIWGILQHGLTDTFAKGITLSDKDILIKATIPEAADETLANKKSSFLGKLLHDKVATTHIYNFQQGLLGQNPNLITPGQQLIIVTFTEDELLTIYHHYAQQGLKE